MDSFALALSYGLLNIDKKSIVITAITVGLFHFIMPLFGSLAGNILFNHIIIKPKYVIFTVFLLLSIDMLLNFFDKRVKLRKLNLFGVVLFAISVSLDSFSVGLGLNYLYDNLILCFTTFCIVSALITIIGFFLGKKVSKKLGKYAFILGSITLFIYSIWVLTN